MKKILLLVCVSLFLPTILMARGLNIYFISHSHTTNERALVKALELVRPSEYSDDAIFYLTNSEKPIISYSGFPGEGVPYQKVIDDIERCSSHDVYPHVDIEKLMEIFTSVEKLRGEYEFVTLNFYIDSIFWDFYRVSVIAKLYHVLELADRPEFLDMNIFFTEGDTPEVDQKYPFGQKYQCEGYTFMPLTLFDN